jgi:hypothetical protein
MWKFPGSGAGGMSTILEDRWLAEQEAAEKGRVKITDHADGRLKERLGLPKSARHSAAQRAFDQGKTHGDARGRLKRYLDRCWLAHRNCNNVRIYGEHLWFFADTTLVTVYEVPKRLRGGA